VREFVSDEFVAKGMLADVAIHAPDRGGDDRNHHAHVMLTMRELTGDGFGLKVRAWNETDQLEQWRESWADAVNRSLERHGHDARVDHRSLADQGVDREPEPKQGPVATEMEREGRLSRAGDDRRAVQARNEQRARNTAELAAISAEIINLNEQRAKRATSGSSSQGQGADDENRVKPTVGPTQGGMVAQQMEALERFRQNSKDLDKRHQEWLRLVDQAAEQQNERDQADQAATDRARQRDLDR